MPSGVYDARLGAMKRSAHSLTSRWYALQVFVAASWNKVSILICMPPECYKSIIHYRIIKLTCSTASNFLQSKKAVGVSSRISLEPILWCAEALHLLKLPIIYFIQRRLLIIIERISLQYIQCSKVLNSVFRDYSPNESNMTNNSFLISAKQYYRTVKTWKILTTSTYKQ